MNNKQVRFLFNLVFKKLFMRNKKESTFEMGTFFLKYNEGKLDVVDENGNRVKGQTSIKVDQDLDCWYDGYCHAEIGMFITPYQEK
jgi:hypothetical protein